jgi:hypothetical protein
MQTGAWVLSEKSNREGNEAEAQTTATTVRISEATADNDDNSPGQTDIKIALIGLPRTSSSRCRSRSEP